MYKERRFYENMSNQDNNNESAEEYNNRVIKELRALRKETQKSLKKKGIKPISFEPYIGGKEPSAKTLKKIKKIFKQMAEKRKKEKT